MEPWKTEQLMRRYTSQQSGFTLIEILIALTVMAAASGVLIGMQSAAIARTFRDKNAQQGMLLARRIMASVEASADNPAALVNFENESALGALQKFGIPEPTEASEKKVLTPFAVTMLVEDFPLPIPNMEEDPMKKITLRVSWGSDVDQNIIIAYLMAVPKP